MFPLGTCRAAWTILLNQFANGTNVISPQLAEELVLWINGAWDKNNYLHRYLPVLEKGASISYADLTAPMTLMMATLCKRSLTGDSEEGFQFQPGEVLALGSSNCFTMAEAAISLNRVEKLLALSEQAAAMDIEAERSTPFIISKAAEDIAQWKEKREVIARMRSFMKGSRVWFDQPSSIHPFVTLRASPDILATAREALNTAKKIIKDMANGHQGNPVVVGPWNSSINSVEIGPVCSFDSTRLFIAYSNLQQAMSCLAVSIAQRANHLVNHNGPTCGQLFSRRFEIYVEASLREVLMAGQPIPAAVGRTNMAAGYDWAAPAAQAADQLDRMVAGLKRLVGVHLVISCAVVDHKLGKEAEFSIGYGLQDLYYNIHQHSYHHLPLTTQFSFAEVLNIVNGYVESVPKMSVDEGIELYKTSTENNGVLNNEDGYVERVSKISIDEGIELYKTSSEEAINLGTDQFGDDLCVGAYR